MSGKQADYRAGRFAELCCCALLLCKGYRVLARNLRTPMGEIDIVAAHGDTLAVVEVKARTSRAAALGAVSPQQRQRLVRAARAFLAQHPHYNGCTLRFDVMALRRNGFPLHIKDAWQE